MFEDAGQALLGDLEDIEEIGNPEAGIAVNEVQHAVMRAAEAEVVEQGVRLAGKVAIREEQQLDVRDQRIIRD